MSNYHVEPVDRPQALVARGDQVAAPRTRSRASRGGSSCATRSAGRWPLWLLEVTAGHDRLPLAEPVGRLRRQGQDRHARRRQAREHVAADRRRLPGLLPGGAGLHRPHRHRPPAVRARRGHDAVTARRSTSGRSTSAARTSAAGRTRASRTSGSSARATARATTASGSRPPAPSTGRRRGAWIASPRPSTSDGVLTLDTGKITLGPAPGRARPAGHHPAADPDRLHLMTDETPATPAPVPPRHRRSARPPSARGAPAGDPAARAAAGPSGSPRPRRSRRPTASRPSAAAAIVRQSSSARWVGFLAVVFVILFVVGYWFYELGAPLGLSTPRLAGRDQRPAGDRRSSAATTSTRRTAPAATARPGWASRIPRRPTKGYIGPPLNEQEKLFAPPQRGVPPERPDGRRPLRLRQRQVADAGLVEPGQPAGPLNYIQIDDADRVHPRAQHGDLRRQGSVAQRAGHRPGDRQGEDVQRLARPELQAGARARRRSRTAGSTRSPAVAAAARPRPRRSTRTRRS